MPEDTTKASFAVEMQDQVSSGAISAKEALEKLQDQLGADTRALNDMLKAQRQLKASTTADVAKPLAELTGRIEAMKNEIASSQAAVIGFGGKFGGAAKGATGLKAQLQELAKASQVMPGPIGAVTNKLVSFVSNMSAAQRTTLLLGAAFLGTAAAAAVFTKSLFESALASQDAARNELLHFEALTKMRNLFGIAPGKASDLQAAVDKVSASVSIGRDKVAGYAEQLYRSGLRGKVLDDALEGTAIKASALGDAAGSGFAAFAGSMALAGGSVKRLSDDVKNRFGGIVQRQMSSLTVQQVKMRENWASLFRGINIEPFLDALKRLRDILNSNTAAGQALKGLFTTFLQPLFNAAETGLVFMRRFFKQMLIGALEMKIAYQEVRNWFARTFGKSQTQQAQSLLDTIQLGRFAIYILAAAFLWLAGTVLVSAVTALISFGVALFATVVPALISATVAAASFAVAILAVTWPFLLAAVAVAAFIAGVAALYDLWNEIDWTDLGRSLWTGLVNGLKAGWEAVKSVFSDLASQAANAFKSALGMQSPSKVFAELGVNIPAGVAVGIERGTPEAQQAAAKMVQVPRAPQVQQAAADTVQAPALGTGTQTGAARTDQGTGTSARAAGPNNITIGELHIHAATSEPKALATAFRRELEAVLEGVSLQLGAEPLGAAP